MNNRTAESGLEFVLDNRKLIIAFALLIAICGCFFIVGFIEGKRQGRQEGSRAAAETLPKASPTGGQERETKPADADKSTRPLNESSAEEQLGWYKSVNRQEGSAPITPQRTESDLSKKATVSTPLPAEPAVKPKPQVTIAHSTPNSYSVQVGAFRQRKEAEIKAQMLQSKGYDCRIEPPNPPGQLFLLKVGKFKTRAEAVAMQLRLKKSGFTSFIKAN